MATKNAMLLKAIKTLQQITEEIDDAEIDGMSDQEIKKYLEEDGSNSNDFHVKHQATLDKYRNKADLGGVIESIKDFAQATIQSYIFPYHQKVLTASSYPEVKKKYRPMRGVEISYKAIPTGSPSEGDGKVSITWKTVIPPKHECDHFLQFQNLETKKVIWKQKLNDYKVGNKTISSIEVGFNLLTTRWSVDYIHSPKVAKD